MHDHKRFILFCEIITFLACGYAYRQKQFNCHCGAAAVDLITHYDVVTSALEYRHRWKECFWWTAVPNLYNTVRGVLLSRVFVLHSNFCVM